MNQKEDMKQQNGKKTHKRTHEEKQPFNFIKRSD